MILKITPSEAPRLLESDDLASLEVDISLVTSTADAARAVGGTGYAAAFWSRSGPGSVSRPDGG